MHIVRAFMGMGLFLALLGFSACKAEETEERGSPSLAPACDDGSCVVHDGLRHCPLGQAQVSSADGRYVEVSGMGEVGKDGVAISLPEVTSFTPTGRHEVDGDSSLLARAISDGIITSTLSDITAGSEVKLSASFTGNGTASTYSAIFSRAGEEVARISRIPSGDDVPTPVNRPCVGCPPRPAWAFQLASSHRLQEDLPGACSWKQTFGEDQPSTIQLESGEIVEVDQVELLEEVPAKGSYSYVSFDRIDYTYDSGTLILEKEEIH